MRREEGFTMIEVMLVVTISGIVMGVLTAAISLGFKATQEAESQLAVAHDSEYLASHFVPDVAGARDFSTGGTACVADPLVRFTHKDIDVLSTVAYKVSRSGGEHHLVRYECVGSATDETIIVRHLGDAAPVIACNPGCSGIPEQVSLTLSMCLRNAAEQCVGNQSDELILTATPRGSV